MNWREGLLAVRGKGNRHDVLPLPADVGQAMAGYLTLARPGRPASPYLFTCVVAPYGPLRASSVGGIVSRACRRRASRRSGRTGCGTPWPVTWSPGGPRWRKSPSYRATAT